MAGPRFVVYSRLNCPLCDEFVSGLMRLLAPSGERMDLRDVDADPVTRRRYGLKIPVLTVDGSPVCHGRLDAAAVTRLLAR
ncbi:MAG: glutaredoxin family protein [Steroidobacteraceae bacterium]